MQSAECRVRLDCDDEAHRDEENGLRDDAEVEQVQKRRRPLLQNFAVNSSDVVAETLAVSMALSTVDDICSVFGLLFKILEKNI